MSSLDNSSNIYLVLPFTKLHTISFKVLPKSIMLNRESWSSDSTSWCECFMHFPTVVDAALGELEQNILEWERHFVLLTCFLSHVSVLQWRGVTRPLGAKACTVFKSVFELFVLVTTCWRLHLLLLAKWWLLHCWLTMHCQQTEFSPHRWVHLLPVQLNWLKSCWWWID